MTRGTIQFRRNRLSWGACDCQHCKYGRRNKAWKKLMPGSIRRAERKQWRSDNG